VRQKSEPPYVGCYGSEVQGAKLLGEFSLWLSPTEEGKSPPNFDS